jgi:hypothetical protein
MAWGDVCRQMGHTITPLNPAKGDPRIGVYVSLGQAF